MKVLLGKLELNHSPKNPGDFDENFWFFDKLSWGLLSSWSHAINEDSWPEGDWIIVRPQGSQYDTIALWTAPSRPNWKALASLVEDGAQFFSHSSIGQDEFELFPESWGKTQKLAEV